MGISRSQALDCFASDDLIGIGMEADSVRRGLHPDGVVTYTVDRVFPCNGKVDELLAAIGPVLLEGVTTIRFVTPFNLSMDLAEFEATLAAVRERFPTLHLQALAAGEVIGMAGASSLSEDAVLRRLHAAGLDAIDSSNAGLSPDKWLQVNALAHHAGLRSRASLGFGGTAGIEQFVDQLMALHALQEETGGFTALTLHGLLPDGDRPEFEQPTAVEYLRTLAIARMVLDNFENVESSAVDEGLKVMQMALRFGANDGGAIPGPESSFPNSFTESDLRRVIRDAGFVPVERDAFYRTMFLNN